MYDDLSVGDRVIVLNLDDVEVVGTIEEHLDSDGEYYIAYPNIDDEIVYRYIHYSEIIGMESEYVKPEPKPCGLTLFLEKHSGL